MWKEMVVVLFEIPSRSLPGGKEKMEDKVIIMSLSRCEYLICSTVSAVSVVGTKLAAAKKKGTSAYTTLCSLIP
jgi:hypothetical protein